MSEVLDRRFAEIGARLVVPERPWTGLPLIDVRTDGIGEAFDIRFDRRHPRWHRAGLERDREVELVVVDVRPEQRHLLLLVRDADEKSKFLCGHDERHWFVAAIPESAHGVTGVEMAMVALQPPAVHRRIDRVRKKNRFRRRNAAYVRQGEWFFVPAVLEPEPLEIEVLRGEPLRAAAARRT